MLLKVRNSKPRVNPRSAGADDVGALRLVKKLMKQPIVNRDLLVARTQLLDKGLRGFNRGQFIFGAVQ